MVQGEIPEGCGLLFASGVLKWPSCCGYAAACGRAHRHRLLRIKIITNLDCSMAARVNSHRSRYSNQESCCRRVRTHGNCLQARKSLHP